MSSAFAIDPVRRPTAPVAPERLAPAADPVARPRPAIRPRVLGASLIVAGVGGVLAAQLLLSIGTADGAFRLQALQDRSVELTREQVVRTEQLQTLAAPQYLAARAAALGMVPQDVPAYLTPTGKVLGAQSVAGAADTASRGAVPDALLTH
ncbi:MAG TPA: hypothetical protein VGO26_03690 [Amnibacterium sp.]|jgi:hypothetical protein|nr:hypothetical protein [Amnibacterium sp.]